MSVDPQTGHIRELRLVGPKYDDAFMERTRVLVRLEHLTLQGTMITATGLKHVAELPSLKSLTVVGTPRFEVDEVLGVLATLPDLRFVRVLDWNAAKSNSSRLATALPDVQWIFAPVAKPARR